MPTLKELSEITRRALPSVQEINMRLLYKANPMLKLLMENAERDTVHGWPGDRPVTLSGFVGATYRKADSQGGVFPNSWHLPRDCAEELAVDCADHFRRMGGFRDNNGQPAPPPSSGDLLASMETGEMKLRAVSVYTTKASETQAELRPPIKCTGNGQYWVEWVEHNIREVWEWVMNDARHPDGIWRRPNGMLDYPQCAYGVGWRYLGPAEWRAHMQAVTPGMWSDETVRADKARIATLETENTALRTERDYERARLAEWQDAATAGLLPVPRAHDFGVPAACGVGGAAVDAAVAAATQDPRPTNPTDAVHEEVERVIGHIADGKVTKTGRTALRGALDKAETPPTGRTASDAAIGRIAGLR